MPIIKHLVQKKLVDKDKASSLEFEVKQSGQTEEEFLLNRGIVSESDLFNLKSEVLKIALKSVEADKVPLKTLELIPEETAKHYQMIPLNKTEKSLEVGMIYPEDLRAQEALKFLSRQGKFDYRVFLITPSTFKSLLRQYRTLKREVGVALEELETELREEKIKISASVNEFEKLTEDAPITKIVAVILRHAVEGFASDVHIEPTREKLRIRFRLLGELHSSIFLPSKVHAAIVARVKILSNLKIDEMRMPQDGRFSTKVDERSIDFRVSTFPTTLGEKVAIRVLDPLVGLKTFEQLGLADRNLRVLKEGVEKPFGLILATGPTGSGKTTTLYAVLQLLNKEDVNIITLEDPVEYFLDGLNQSQIKPEIGYDFPVGLRHILRQDPDIIMVGEIRDEESAALAVHAALTGHIVLSTLHTNSAIGVVPRLIDMGIKPYLIPPSLQIALAQRLVRRLCPACRKKVKATPEIQELILKKIEALPPLAKKNIKITDPLTVWAPQGCRECHRSGFSGRVGVFEVMSMTEDLAQLIIKEPSESKIMEEARKQGMTTMDQDGILKVLNGETTLEEVLGITEDNY